MGQSILLYIELSISLWYSFIYLYMSTYDIV